MASDGSSPEVCAVFLFPDSAEIRRLRNPPQRGQRVRSTRGDVWYATEVLQSGRSTYTVICAASNVFAESVLHRGSLDLASDLLYAVRKAIRSPDDLTLVKPQLHRRGYMRTDWIDRYLFLGPQYGAHAKRGNTLEAGGGDWLQTYLQRRRQQQHRTASERPWTTLLRAFSEIEHRLRR